MSLPKVACLHVYAANTVQFVIPPLLHPQEQIVTSTDRPSRKRLGRFIHGTPSRGGTLLVLHSGSSFHGWLTSWYVIKQKTGVGYAYKSYMLDNQRNASTKFRPTLTRGCITEIGIQSTVYALCKLRSNTEISLQIPSDVGTRQCTCTSLHLLWRMMQPVVCLCWIRGSCVRGAVRRENTGNLHCHFGIQQWLNPVSAFRSNRKNTNVFAYKRLE